MSHPTYWVRYRIEDDDGHYHEKTAKAGTLMSLAAQINEIVEHGWHVVGVGATSPRPLDEKERQVIQALTRGRVEIS